MKTFCLIFSLFIALASQAQPSIRNASAGTFHNHTNTVTGGGGGGADTTTGLIGWWKLDDGSGSTAVDSSVSGNNATLIASPTWTTGHINGGLQFVVPNNQSATANTTAIGGLTHATIAGWINRSSSSDTMAFGAGSNGTADRFNFLWFSDGNIYFDFGNADGTKYAHCALAGTGWHHVAMVFDGALTGNARITAYVDGVAQTLIFNNPPPASLSSSAALGNFVIGTDSSGSADSNGIFDDIRVYNRAMPLADVAALAAM